MKFDPDRFAEPRNEHKKHRYAFTPFGGGSHKCIGMVFGQLEVKMIMHRLLRKYRLELAHPGTRAAVGLRRHARADGRHADRPSPAALTVAQDQQLASAGQRRRAVGDAHRDRRPGVGQARRPPRSSSACAAARRRRESPYLWRLFGIRDVVVGTAHAARVRATTARRGSTFGLVCDAADGSAAAASVDATAHSRRRRPPWSPCPRRPSAWESGRWATACADRAAQSRSRVSRFAQAITARSADCVGVLGPAHRPLVARRRRCRG